MDHPTISYLKLFKRSEILTRIGNLTQVTIFHLQLQVITCIISSEVGWSHYHVHTTMNFFTLIAYRTTSYFFRGLSTISSWYLFIRFCSYSTNLHQQATLWKSSSLEVPPISIYKSVCIFCVFIHDFCCSRNPICCSNQRLQPQPAASSPETVDVPIQPDQLARPRPQMGDS